MLYKLCILAFIVPLALGVDVLQSTAPCGAEVANKSTIDFTSHDANQTCVWKFTTEETKRYFAITNFSLGPQDFLLVYDSNYNDTANGTSVEKLTGNFTGKMDPFLVVTFSNVSTIVFRSGPKESNNSNFKIDFNTNKCTLFMNQTTGVVQSPIYNPSPHEALVCSYHLMTEDPKGRLVLVFDTVSILKGNVTIWDGATSIGPSIVTSIGPMKSLSDVVSSNRSLVIQTTFPTSVVENFTATFFTANHDCTLGMITLDKAKNLTSPAYPAKYPSNLDCRFIIAAPEGSTIAVNINDIDLGDDVDSVILNDGDIKSAPLLTSLTAGFKQKGLLLTSGNKLWVRIRTDESRTGRGFNILLTPKKYDGASRYEGHFTIGQATTGIQMDKNTPSEIYHLLFAKPGMQVKLTINDSYIMPTSFIEIWDGSTVNSTLIGYFRTDEPYYPVVSRSGSMLLVLHGFLLEGSPKPQFITADFSSVTPGTQFSLSGVSGSAALIESAFSGKATYVVVNPNPDRLVALAITELYVPVNASVVIFSGASSQSIKFINYTTTPGEDPAKVVPVIYARQARLEFSVKGRPVVKPERILLRFSYRIIQGCDGRELNRESGDVLTSPQYPNLYPANAHCSWTFTPVQNKHLRLSFSDVSFAANHSLTIEADHYKIWIIGNETIHNMTSETLDVLRHDATNLPDVLVMMNNNSLNSTKVKVTFNANFTGKRSDLEVSSGFKISYEHLMCGGNITDPSQVIGTPGFPGPVTGEHVRCVWVINLPKRPAGCNTSVNIVQFKVTIGHWKKNTNTSKTVLELRDGGSARAPLIPLELKDGKTKDLLSRSNVVWVLYSFNRTKKENSQGPSFGISFSVHECSKADQCANGICLHSDWKCNGKDECGDDSDELNCYHASNTVSRLVLGMSILVTFIIATALACIVPVLYKRFKYPNYSQLRDLMTPVPT